MSLASEAQGCRNFSLSTKWVMCVESLSMLVWFTGSATGFTFDCNHKHGQFFLLIYLDNKVLEFEFEFDNQSPQENKKSIMLALAKTQTSTSVVRRMGLRKVSVQCIINEDDTIMN